MAVIDPVCGMEMEQEEVGATLDYGGERYSFCSVECREEFIDNADEYAGLELDDEALGEEGEEAW